jgi:hypothetical protein
MGLTTILTTFGFAHRSTLSVKSLFLRNSTFGDILRHATDVWESASHEFKPRQPDPATAVHAGPGGRTSREKSATP